MKKLSYRHLLEAGADPAAPPLLLLHGTGGNERDLLPIARTVSPGSTLLSPRGDVSESGAMRFFARISEGVFDADEVRRRTHALADFIAAAATEYHLDPARLVAIGFSNGANIAATTLLLRPESLAGAVLLRAMVVLDQPAAAGSLVGKRVLLANGTRDTIVPTEHPRRLAGLLRAGGADVAVHLHDAGHGPTAADISAAQAWFRAQLAR